MKSTKTTKQLNRVKTVRQSKSKKGGAQSTSKKGGAQSTSKKGGAQCTSKKGVVQSKSDDMNNQLKLTGDGGDISIAKTVFRRLSDTPSPIGVFRTYDYKTCLALSEDHQGTIKILRFGDNGLECRQMTKESFNAVYAFPETGSIQYALMAYASKACYLGASDEALKMLNSFIPLTEENINMAKKAAKDRKSPTVEKSKKPQGANAASTESAPVKRPSAAAMFKELIMGGKLTDAEIFAKVQDEFGLPDKHKTYVAWYRNSLRKAGANSPEAVK